MIPAFTIALPHTLLLISYLLLLVYCVIKEVNWGYYLVLGLIGLECYWNYAFGTGDNLLHSAVDLMAIGAISFAVTLTKHRPLRILVLMLGIAGFFGWHLQFEKSANDNSVINQTEHAEYFIEFVSKEALKKWIAAESNTENLTINYPLFSPEDLSFQLDEYVLVSIPTDLSRDFLERVSDQAGILHVELNDPVILEMPITHSFRTNKVSKSFNDPYVDKQWTADQYKLDKFHKLAEKHRIKSQGGVSKIAILDTGVDAQHEDLKENYVSTSNRYDVDVKGHGTHCAGIAAAVTGNKVGIASFIPRAAPVKVTSVKVLSNLGMGSQKSIISGIIKAADEGCSVISLSLGGISSDSKEKAYAEAVKYANAKGSIVIVAAGNSGRDARNYSPANTKGVITVTALDTLMHKADFGNDVSGIEMGIAAPGTSIYSTFPNDEYKAFNGTSMAAPFVSGLVGLMKAYKPDLKTKEVYALLQRSATRKNNQLIVDPLAALELFFREQL